MLEIIVFLVWVIFTIWATAIPYAILCLSALGRGFVTTALAAMLLFAGLSITSWYYIFLYVKTKRK
jgi:hypothetical protein